MTEIGKNSKRTEVGGSNDLLTEEVCKDLGFVDAALMIRENLFFYQHPDGTVRLAYAEYDIGKPITKISDLKIIYKCMTGKEL